jgi:hypothetical protein
MVDPSTHSWIPDKPVGGLAPVVARPTFDALRCAPDCSLARCGSADCALLSGCRGGSPIPCRSFEGLSFRCRSFEGLPFRCCCFEVRSFRFRCSADWDLPASSSWGSLFLCRSSSGSYLSRCSPDRSAGRSLEPSLERRHSASSIILSSRSAASLLPVRRHSSRVATASSISALERRRFSTRLRLSSNRTFLSASK